MVPMVMAQTITDSTKNISDTDILPGVVTCPTCKSDRWNSAITVVMEGSTNAKCTVIRTANAAAKQAGNLHESLLSDRWFSWDYPIEADIGLNASTGLVQEVKRFLVEYGPVVQMPSPPQKPNQATSIRNSPIETQDSPSVDQAPTPCGTVEEPVTWKGSRQSTVRSRLARLSIVIVPLMIGLTGAYVLFGRDFISALSLLIICASITTVAAFKVKSIPRRNMAEDETGRKDIENLSVTLKHYAKDRENFQEEAERFRSRYEESERRLSDYKILTEVAAIYEQRLADYRNRRRAVLKARERLWERTRLCIQCGTAYLGPD
jgi:hypothetical protein